MRAPRASFGLVLPFPGGEPVGVPRIFERFESWVRMQGAPLAGKVNCEVSPTHRAFHFIVLPEQFQGLGLQSMMPLSDLSREAITKVRAQIEESAQGVLEKFVRREGKAGAPLTTRVTVDTLCPTDPARPTERKRLYGFSVRIWIGVATKRESMRAGKAALARGFTPDFSREIIAHSNDIRTLINFAQSTLQHLFVGAPPKVLGLSYGNALFCNVMPGSLGMQRKFASTAANDAAISRARTTFEKKVGIMMHDLQTALWRKLPPMDVVCSTLGNLETQPGGKARRFSHLTLVLFVGLRNSFNAPLREQLFRAGRNHAAPLFVLDANTHLRLVYPEAE